MLRKVTAWAAALGVLGGLVALPAIAESNKKEPEEVHFSFDGPMGKFDQQQLERGLKVYREVCHNCHSMNLVSFQALGEEGGPLWMAKYKKAADNPKVKAFAKSFDIEEIDHDTGDKTKRPGTPADHIPAPFANDYAAMASNGGALPPDMSLLAKAREEGPRYIYSILTGYGQTPPKDLTINAGQHYNPYIAGGIIAMPQPLKADAVTFDDGTKATLEQEAKDVSAFLYWAAEPKQDQRKQMGLAVMIYLLILAGLAYAAYRQVWRNESH